MHVLLTLCANRLSIMQGAAVHRFVFERFLFMQRTFAIFAVIWFLFAAVFLSLGDNSVSQHAMQLHLYMTIGCIALAFMSLVLATEIKRT